MTMFRNVDMKRLRELAGVVEPAPYAKGHVRRPDKDELMQKDQEKQHLEKETSVFHTVHDALEDLLEFLHSQEGFEEKRGKEPEYEEMERCASDLLETMKKHLEGYDDEEAPAETEDLDSDAGLHGEHPVGGTEEP